MARLTRKSYGWRLTVLRLLDRLTGRRQMWILERIVKLRPKGQPRN